MICHNPWMIIMIIIISKWDLNLPTGNVWCKIFQIPKPNHQLKWQKCPFFDRLTIWDHSRKVVLILLYMSGICGSPSEFTLGKWSWSCCTRQEYAAHHLSSLVKSGSRLTIWVLVFLLGLPSEVLSRLQDAGGESQMSKEPCHHRKLDQHHVMPSSIASPTFAQITRWVANRRSPEDFKLANPTSLLC